MKIKKIAAALTASALLCGALTIPANAAEPAYEKGDVNMDGIIDAADATLVMEDFLDYALRNGHILTEEQLALANVYEDEGYVEEKYGLATDVDLNDALAILQYFTAKNMGQEDITFMDAWKYI